MAKILVIDNYDSFVYNLVQYVGQLGATPVVVRNDAIAVAEVDAIGPDGILVSPGPGRPEEAGITERLIQAWAGRAPILGVCLGHQAIGTVFGGQVVRTDVMHGKTSPIHHDGRGVFAGLPEPLVATRYHSLVVADDGLPADLEVSARTADGTIMGLRHRRFDIEGVQFHPESVLTESGHHLMANWLVKCGQASALVAIPSGGLAVA
jgi:anthranilate synthase/aminodeoxychorismate synthase-like glutamine amidotransferase